MVILIDGGGGECFHGIQYLDTGKRVSIWVERDGYRNFDDYGFVVETECDQHEDAGPFLSRFENEVLEENGNVFTTDVPGFWQKGERIETQPDQHEPRW
jgi:hypothetical protein